VREEFAAPAPTASAPARPRVPEPPRSTATSAQVQPGALEQSRTAQAASPAHPSAPEPPRSAPVAATESGPPSVPLAASVVPEPRSLADREEVATEARALAEVEEDVADAHAVRPGATLSWTPLPGAVPVPAAPPADEVRPATGTSLAETLREAPGVLAEAWSAIEAALRAIRAGLGTAGGEQLDVYGRDARLSEAVAPLVDFLYSRWFRVEVEGATRVPTGGALLVANHAGALPLDGPMLHEALRRERPDLPDSRWLAEDQVFYAPLLGTLFNRLGAVRASPDSATRLLAEGRPVLIFPEGIQGIGKPFRDRYRLQRFGRGGFVKLALRTGRPILPVAIMGAEETLPLLGKLPGGPLGVPYLPVTPLPLPAKWRIRIGEPLQTPPGAKETDLSVVESLVEATRSTIEHMLRELLGARGGVFSG
jgi:1-acyl-sn-glycerol-3-phosphate acyltransferase